MGAATSRRGTSDVAYHELWEAHRDESGNWPEEFGDALTSAWAERYRRCTSGHRDVVEITLAELRYLFDATPAPASDEADNRVIGVWGRSAQPEGARDRSRMKGHPSPQRANPQPVDRGHLAAHASGGGYDLNLIPQLATLNRGSGEQGRRWRELERYCAANLGTFFFVHALYADESDHPSELEFGVVDTSRSLRVERFRNR